MNVNEMEKNLTGAYNEAFSTAVQYAMNKGYTKEKINESMSDLYDLLLTAQEDGRPVEKVIGKDISYFCKNYFGKYSVSDFLKSTGEFIFRACIFLVSWELLNFVFYSGGFIAYMGEKADITPYIFGLSIAIVTNVISFFVVAPLTAKNRKAGDWSNILLCAAMFAAVFLSTEYKLPIDANVKVWAILTILVSYIVIYFTIRSVIRYRKYGTICDIYKKAFKENWKKAYQDYPMQKGVLEGWQWRYKRLLKKDKVTEETFLEKLKKEQKINIAADKVTTVLMVVLVLPFAFDILRDSEALWAGLIGVAVFCLIEFIAYSIFLKPMKKLTVVFGKLLNECEKSGMTMPKFIEEKLKEHKI
ncbi:MAG: hypothetical protein IKJ87_08205 [Ruminococcus sp.]|nr:hypothetical protein [Ruminococcus sp.]